jgi:selenocysteine-specific elongation factor
MTERLILGTAGHIDHGKTTLVRALTGVDCDRLPEEKERGITIELGFAPLELPSGLRLGIVDVPGHERLVRTMVSGATGIDLVLFVVAADESIMPQSLEHLAICELLGVDRGVVALTKVDAVDAELAQLARLEVEETIERSALAGAPVVGVSAVTGEGLPELMAQLERVAREAPPRTLRDGPAWLPVDRVFTMRGFGTVVTGTLRGAPLEEGAPVELFADGELAPLATRIRGLQVHGESTKRVLPGSRCAVNLHGLEVQQVPRGSVVATPGRVAPRPKIDVELTLLPAAPPLRNAGTLTVHVGTAERGARVRLFDRQRLEPGDRALGELRFATPVVVVEGDRFILRGYARTSEGGWTVGGGRVLDVAPPRGRRSRKLRLAELETLAGGDRSAALGVRLRRAGVRGIHEPDLLRDFRSIEGIPGVRVGSDRWMDSEAMEDVRRRVVEAVEAHHRERPLEPWVGLAPVAAHLGPPCPEDVIRVALETAAERGELEAEASGYRSPGHTARAGDPEQVRKLLQRLRDAALAPPTVEALAREGKQEIPQLRALLEHLVREGELVRVTSEFFFSRPAIDELRRRLLAHLREYGSIDPSAYKDLVGQTRKFTVPLMEYFDTEKLTIRRGNVRVLRGEGS